MHWDPRNFSQHIKGFLFHFYFTLFFRDVLKAFPPPHRNQTVKQGGFLLKKYLLTLNSSRLFSEAPSQRLHCTDFIGWTIRLLLLCPI